jgi:uncharacterized protein
MSDIRESIDLGKLPFGAVTKPTGAACNLACSYCFFLDKDLLYPGPSQSMGEDQLQEYVRAFLDSQPDGPVTFTWQGGEPTLMGLDFFRRAVEFGEEYRRSAQDVSHSFQTNGVMINDKWAQLLAENNFLVGLSIDGPKDIHDSFRVNKAGRGTFDQVVRGWRCLQRHGVETNILCTVHSANAERPHDVYRFFRDELGAKYLQFIPIVEHLTREQLQTAQRTPQSGSNRTTLSSLQGEDAVTARSVKPLEYGTFLSAIFDEWSSVDIGRIYVQTFDSILSAMFGRYTLCVNAPECGNALAVMNNGDVYSCDHFVEPDYLLGNVRKRTFQQMLTSPSQREFGRSKRTSLPVQCQRCPQLWACHGGCPKDRFAKTSDGESGLNYLCEGYSQFVEHIQEPMSVMADLLRRGRAPAEIMSTEQAKRPSFLEV